MFASRRRAALGLKEVNNMSDLVIQDGYGRIVDAFKEMRDEMHRNQRYSKKQLVAADRLYEAIREFAPHIEAAPPYLPIGDGC
jgi:hypothetical protein